MFKEYFKKIYKKLYIYQNLYYQNKIFLNRNYYSHHKEDIFVLKYFKNKKEGLYVDVGCHHPTRLNNTYLLYKHGWRGVNIDMSEISIDLFNKVRSQDLNIHSAVSCKNGIIKYYTNKELFLRASLIPKKGKEKFKYSKKVKSKKLDQILDKTKYKKSSIDFLSVDAEGADFEVLKSLNFKKYKPKLICVEIWKNSIQNSDIKKHKIYKFLSKKKYNFVKKLADNYFFELNLIKS